MSCIIMQWRTCTMRSKSGVLWKKDPPQLMYYFDTPRQGRLSDRKEIPIVMNKTVRCCSKEALESRVQVTKQSHSRYLNSQKKKGK